LGWVEVVVDRVARAGVDRVARAGLRVRVLDAVERRVAVDFLVAAVLRPAGLLVLVAIFGLSRY
jgi:hypothetical protein